MLRVTMIDTMDQRCLEGPNGFSVEVTNIGIVGGLCRQQTWWPEAICCLLALAPIGLYAKNRRMAARVLSISSSV